MSYRVGGWYLYDISESFADYDLCQIVESMDNCYVLKMYTHGHCFPGITIVKHEFEKASLPISDQDAMIEKLKREIC